jgi:hypothetical protein
MLKRRFLIAAAAITITGALVPVAGADDGNVAVGSVGTAQVGSTASAPSVDATTSAGTANVTVPVDVVGSGGNTSQGSIGSVQVGGGNGASSSVGTAQVSAVHGTPHAHVNGRIVNADVSSPASVPGSGSNAASGSLVTVQAGGGHSASGSFAQVQAAQPSLEPKASAGLGDLGSVQIGNAGQVPVNVTTGSPTLALRAQADVFRDVTLNLASMLLQFRNVGVSPDLYTALQPIAAFGLGGWIGTGPNDGNSTPGSFGVAQIGSIAIAPIFAVDSAALGSSATVGGASGVDGIGTNTAGDSLGTLQAGGGNIADGSAGTAQVGGLRLAPSSRAATPYGALALGGSSGIAGGSNSAAGSLGTVQVGGGNNADGSAGTAQVGDTSVAPTLSATGTPAGDVSTGGSSSIAGSGNDATGSLGTVQIGGGNTADGSGGTTQSSGIVVGPTVSVGDTPVGGTTVGVPTNVGEGNGNTSTGSLGTAQVGGGNSATGSIGTAQVGSQTPTPTPVPTESGPTISTLSLDNTASSGSLTAAPAAPSATPSVTPPAAKAAPAKHQAVLPAPSKTLTGNRTIGSLPFTGLDLLFAVLLGMALIAAGMGVRTRARTVAGVR